MSESYCPAEWDTSDGERHSCMFPDDDHVQHECTCGKILYAVLEDDDT